jgi:alpha-glucosidase
VTAAPEKLEGAQRAEEPRPGPWWQEAIIYENHLPSFRDANGDGIGDIQGLTESLDYLAGVLGVTAVWVGPFFRSPLLDQGFDIVDHKDVEPVFGDLGDVDRLLSAAHARGLKVIVDYVPNHTSDKHPWFVESRSSPRSDKRDWYIWADARAGERYPNNWTSEAGGSVWEWDEGSGQFYLHSHLREQPDLNWRNPEVRSAMLDVLRFWLDRGVDGVRIDVAHMLMKDPGLRDNPENPDGSPNPYDVQHPEFTSQLHVNDRMHPDLHEVLREIRRVADAYGGDRVTIGEVEATEWERWAAYFGEELDELALPFAFQLIETPWEAPALAEVLGELEAALPEGGWPILALGNHDRPRLATRLGRSQARVAAMLLLTLRGTPTLLYGDELGLVDQEVPRELQRDYFGFTSGGASRDPIRTPMPWSAAPNAGFAPESVRQTWLPICREYSTLNVEAQLRDPSSMLNLYRRLVAARKRSRALGTGGFAQHRASNAHCLVYERQAQGERKLVAMNLTPQPHDLVIDERGSVTLSTNPGREDEPVDGLLRVEADEGVIVDLRRGGA